MSKSKIQKKIIVNAITWTIIFGSLHFYVKLLMGRRYTWRSPDWILSFPTIIKMAATWRLFFSTKFSLFFQIFLKHGLYRFSGSASLLALSVFVWDRKRGYGGHLHENGDDLIRFSKWPIIKMTDNLNGRHLATIFFRFFFFSEFPWNLVYIDTGLWVY